MDILGRTHALARRNQRIAYVCLIETEAAGKGVDLFFSANLRLSFLGEIFIDMSFGIDLIVFFLFICLFHDLLDFYLLLTDSQYVSFLQNIPLFRERLDDHPRLLFSFQYFSNNVV
jgi:hypothetical protein